MNDLKREWKEITNPLYRKISPRKGRLKTYINPSSDLRLGFIVELELNEFTFEDPFYGEIKSNNRIMYIELIDFQKENGINQITDFENKEIFNRNNEIDGFLTNSLLVITREMNFGRICSGKIEFKLEYTLTNSDSYALMKGTKKDHLGSNGKITLELDIPKLLIQGHDLTRVGKILKNLNSTIYNKEEIIRKELVPYKKEVWNFEVQYLLEKLKEKED